MLIDITQRETYTNGTNTIRMGKFLNKLINNNSINKGINISNKDFNASCFIIFLRF